MTIFMLEENIRETLTVDDVIDFLNDLIVRDYHAVRRMTGISIPCNRSLVSHPSLQVDLGEEGVPASFSILGLINALYGPHNKDHLKGYGQICLISGDTDKGEVYRFGRTKDVIKNG